MKSKEKGCSSCCRNENGGFRERVFDFSLEIRAIRPSAVFGTRRRTALRGESFAWVQNLGSFLKLLEVVVSPYLGFIPLSVFQCFGWYEALNGRLIGLKPWDRIDMIFWKPKCLARNCECCLGLLIHKVCIKSCIDCNEAVRGRLIGPKLLLEFV